MKELIFEVLEDSSGGFTASALGYGIHTQGETEKDLKEQIREAVDCYFDESSDIPKSIRLHFIRDEIMAL